MRLHYVWEHQLHFNVNMNTQQGWILMRGFIRFGFNPIKGCYTSTLGFRFENAKDF